jgi:hypothetical protein
LGLELRVDSAALDEEYAACSKEIAKGPLWGEDSTEEKLGESVSQRLL